MKVIKRVGDSWSRKLMVAVGWIICSFDDVELAPRRIFRGWPGIRKQQSHDVIDFGTRQTLQTYLSDEDLKQGSLRLMAGGLYSGCIFTGTSLGSPSISWVVEMGLTL